MENKKSGLSTASLTLGIISIVLCAFWYIAMPAGILALVFGMKGVNKTGSKVAKAGIVTAIVGLTLFTLFYMAAILIIFFN